MRAGEDDRTRHHFTRTIGHHPREPIAAERGKADGYIGVQPVCQPTLLRLHRGIAARGVVEEKKTLVLYDEAA